MISVVGIDPGKSGYVARIAANDSGHRTVVLRPTPTVNLGGGKRDYHPQRMRDLLLALNAKEKIALVALEVQRPMPKQGVHSMFVIGRGVGLWEGILAGLQLPYTLVQPRDWQAYSLRGTPGDDAKGRSILATERLYPMASLLRTPRSTKPDHNAADAVMIAHWALHHVAQPIENAVRTCER